MLEMSRVVGGLGGGAHTWAPSAGDGLPGIAGGELEEHLLEPGTLGTPQVDQDDSCRCGRAADVDLLGLGPEPSVTRRCGLDARCRQRLLESSRVLGLHVGPGRVQQLGLGPLRHDLAAADEHHLVGDHLDLVQQVRGQQHGPAPGGEGAEQAAHPVDAGGVQAVDRLVEDQHGRVTHERVGDAEALAHAQRVVAHPPLGLGAGETDQLQHLLDALACRRPCSRRTAAAPRGRCGRRAGPRRPAGRRRGETGSGCRRTGGRRSGPAPRSGESARPSPACSWTSRHRWGRGSRSPCRPVRRRRCRRPR